MEFRILGREGERQEHGAEKALAFTLLPQPNRVHEARNRVCAFGHEQGLSAEDLCEFLIAFGEAVANAIEHAHTQMPIEVECRFAGGRILASVRDFGVGFPVRALDGAAGPVASLDAERGRGIAIMRACSDFFAVHSDPYEGTTVTIGLVVGTLAAGAPERIAV